MNIQDLSEFSEQVYTVKRTSGILESGWILGRPHIEGLDGNKYAYFDFKESKWRIYTQNGKENPNEFLFAWRDLEKIFPTSLEGKDDEINNWRKKVLYALEILEAKRRLSLSDPTKN